MIVTVVPEADPPYALVEGIRSSRALSTFIRAVMGWYAFGRYNYVMVDLSSFGDWSPAVVDEVAAVADAATDAGHGLRSSPSPPTGSAAPGMAFPAASRTGRTYSGPCGSTGPPGLAPMRPGGVPCFCSVAGEEQCPGERRVLDFSWAGTFAGGVHEALGLLDADERDLCAGAGRWHSLAGRGLLI